MKTEELKKLLEGGENEQVEFKEGNPSTEAIAETVCAFLNRKGGRILIGVSDAGQPVGLPDASSVYRRIEHQLQNLITPLALWSIEEMNYEGRDLVIVEVPEGMDKPYIAGGSIRIRSGKKDFPATRDDISALIQKRAESSGRWERQIAVGAGIEDLDKGLIVETAQLALTSDRWQGKPQDVESFLYSFGLLTSGNLTKAALVLYGKNPTRFLPQARVRLTVMSKGKTGDQYLMDKAFDSCLLRTAQEIQDSLGIHAGGVESTFSEKDWLRTDRPLYPMAALREGVMNALVHRDYESNGAILISVLPDSIKIVNPGGLPKGLDVPDLKKEHLSLPPNPDIAHICFLHRLIEKVGRGTQMIVETCRRAKMKTPQWKSSPRETSLTFFSFVIRGGEIKLNENQRKILDALKSKDTMNINEIVSFVGGKMTDRTARNYLNLLIRMRLVVRNGQGPSTTYSLAKQD